MSYLDFPTSMDVAFSPSAASWSLITDSINQQFSDGDVSDHDTPIILDTQAGDK